MADSERPGVDLTDLTGFLGYQLRQAQAASFRDLSGPLKELGITPGEFSLLTIINANPGLRQNVLVQVYGLDKSTLSVSVAALVRRGLIEQRRDRADRRRHSLQLTEEGEEALAAATRIVEDQERRILAAIGKGQREELMDSLRRIVAALQDG